MCDDIGYLSVYRRVTCLTIMGGNKVFEHAQRRLHTLKKEGHLTLWGPSFLLKVIFTLYNS